MNQQKPTNATLLVSTHCPHCHTLEKLLQERLTGKRIAALNVINIEQHPETANDYGVRSVPWLKLGNFIFNEGLKPAELDRWIDLAQTQQGQSEYIAYLLANGKLGQALEWIEADTERLFALIPLLSDLDAKINVRVGLGAILEHFEDTEALRKLVPDLTALLDNESTTVRLDVCHYLALTHSDAAIEPLQNMLNDREPQVREIAQESLGELQKNN